ncbi:phosphoadenylyl-sulfate reductase [Micromonospora parathelypteridis]|uniref:Adenosine 5'-phosphosulfate reductase n=1 Tax=Micromonospora parathelypteridis TaxID=1839617 RepID=A0A840W2C1_9ACTN|nr:phosphoadenylyl-sulfate reductase [Micromonospora parathelypteridis]MBB5477341.1 phosphoadenosine phosphosulfate reductase [Micromonospora parathelypteridis]GGO09434.1 phosphoadenosine phosphosulfate reductase [Micromonospora parathelypteridis]
MSLVSAAGLRLVGPGGPTPADPARRSPDELRSLAEQAARDLEGAPALEIARWAAQTFGDRFCVTSSMADAVLAHLVSRVAPGVDVVFLDTGLHFPETLRVRDEVARTLPVNVRSIRPRLTVGQQDGQYGPRLFNKSPDDCCQLRKVEPLERALTGYDAWAAGLRRDESPTRANTPVVTFDPRRAKVKVNPIAAWSQGDVDAYIARFNVPVNELFKQGYGSIGCWPCTRQTKAGEDARAGRWAMFEKTECGLHV